MHTSWSSTAGQRRLSLQSFLSAISRRGVCVSFLSFRLLQQCTWSWRKNCRLGAAMDGPGWSHVYGGRLTIGKQTCVVVVELYQECMFRDPSPLNYYGLEGIFDGDWPSGTEVAQREAWAYKQLQQYQGSTVPYSYGFYTITYFLGSERK